MAVAVLRWVLLWLIAVAGLAIILSVRSITTSCALDLGYLGIGDSRDAVDRQQHSVLWLCADFWHVRKDLRGWGE